MTRTTCVRAPQSPRYALVAALLPLAQSLSGQSVEPTVFEPTGVFAAAALTESSGVAVSRRHDGLLWTHNDSGDDPLLYATDLAGRNRGAYRIRNAEAEDWEDIALGPCPSALGSCLYVADTGDNRQRRPYAVIYILPEPDPPASAARSPARLTARGVRVTYPDRPHDVEALAVHPDGTVFLVTKGRTGPVLVYRIARADLRDTVTARLTDTLAIVPQLGLGRLVTGAAFSPSGARLAVRTYTQVFFYRLEGPRLRQDGPTCWLGPREPQGEGVDFLDEENLVLTSEGVMGRPGVISRVRCPRERPPARR